MNVRNKNYMRNFVGFLTIAMVLLSSQHSSAYEKEIKGISSTIAESIAKSGKKTIAVVDFTGLQGNVTELGRFLAEELSVELVNIASGFSVIDRAHLKSILAEHKLSISGIADPKAVKKLGQIAGVDAIITGTVTPLENSIRVTAKVIATDTANVIGAAKCDIAKTRAIEELLSRGIETEGSFPTEAASTSKTTPSFGTDAKSERLFFEDIFPEGNKIKITVKSLKKMGRIIKLVLLYENIGEEDMFLALDEAEGKGLYLTDENGDKWDLKAEDVENIAKVHRRDYSHEYSKALTLFPPKLPKMVKLFFVPKDASTGTLFTAVLDHHATINNKKAYIFQAVIRNIPINK